MINGVGVKDWRRTVFEGWVAACLIGVPLFFLPGIEQSFSQGKELFFRGLVLAMLLVFGSAGLAVAGRVRVRPVWESPMAALILLASGVAMATDAVSPTPWVAVFGTFERGLGLATDFFLLVFGLACAMVLERGAVIRLVRYSFWGGVAVSLYGIAQRMGFDPLFGHFDRSIFVGRVFSFLGNPGFLGQFLLLVLLQGVFLWSQSKEARSKWGYAAGSALVFVAMVFSGARAPFFSLVLCVLLAMVRYRSVVVGWFAGIRGRRLVWAAMALSLVALLAVLSDRGGRFSFSEESFRSVRSRFEIWGSAVELVSRRPWLGYGQETFSIHFPEVVTRRFLALEEDAGLNADRIHNEFIESVYSHGVVAGLLYLVMFGVVLGVFLRSKDPIVALLSLMVLANVAQNQFGFSDLSIRVWIAFALGSLVGLRVGGRRPYEIPLGGFRWGLACLAVLAGIGLAYGSVWRPLMANLHQSRSRAHYAVDYGVAVAEARLALGFAPYFGRLWYDLMFLDPSSMGGALERLERIEGESGTVLAWKGNHLAPSDPERASGYFLEAIGRNPGNPNWVRAFADMLFGNGDFGGALFMYERYLEALPEAWRLGEGEGDLDPTQKRSFRIFLKNTPDFRKTYERIQVLRGMAEEGRSNP